MSQRRSSPTVDDAVVEARRPGCAGALLRLTRPNSASVAGTRCRRSRTAPVGRHFGVVCQPKPPWAIRALAHPDAGTAPRSGRIAQGESDRTGRREQVNLVVCHRDSERLTEIARAACNRRRTQGPAAATEGHVCPVPYRSRSEQDGARNSVVADHHIRADVDAVTQVGVEPPRRAEHDGAAWSWAAKGMRCGVWPGSVGRSSVRLDLHDHRRRSPAAEQAAEQALSGRDWIDREWLGIHVSIVPGALDTPVTGEHYSSHDDFIT